MNNWMGSPFSRFKAMPRLVDEAEFAELAREPGFDAEMVRKLRRERRRVFRLYLAELIGEFKNLEREAMDRAANDPMVDPMFLEKVLGIKLRFFWSTALLRAGLMLPTYSSPFIYRKTRELVGTLQPLGSN